ncbi:hypothetical protein FEM48_Zijuj04G0142800 [Ziziphus jujuba var. spinosa]|uniref:SANT domain-containing protein n=1 Tax=Ziziphus jujuba var. spinosa TaxID=714518 RepID=A0A978VKC9_ZIZJJ|nr:hypothetical protein FEM48_Zijuj04G0142800 [Ziziphus jujuba var. spinosa]
MYPVNDTSFNIDGLVKEIANPKGLFPIVITVTKISRIKRVVWSDFDRSIECFSVGVEGTPHNSEHPYRVMGIEIYGSRNWSEVAEHVGIKSKAQCINHYNATICMNSPFFPLLDLSHVMKKSREELLAMAKELKKEVPMLGEVTVEEESPFQSESQVHIYIYIYIILCILGLNAVGTGPVLGAVKKTSNKIQINDEAKAEGGQEYWREKAWLSGVEKPFMMEFSGYNFKRQVFEIEYDNDAEELLADMEFKDSDTNTEREIKLRVLHPEKQLRA